MEDISEVKAETLISDTASPITNYIDGTYTYGPYAIQTDQTLMLRKSYYNPSGAVNISILCKASLRNLNSDRKFSDIYIILRTTTYDRNGAFAHKIETVIYENTFETHEIINQQKGTAVEIPANGYVQFELVCTRVYAFNDNGADPIWKGNFEIINESSYKVEVIP